MKEGIRSKLAKIHALATSGAPGEREAAQERLAALCAKYDVDPADLVSDEAIPHEFKFRGDDVRILTQVVVMICDRNNIPNRIGAKRQVFWMTNAEGIDVRAAVDHYRKEWRKVRKDALTAFIHRNRLFGGSAQAEDYEFTPEELAEMERVMKMMNAQDKAEPWNRRIEG